ncbi:hypothetical protein A7U60_g7702 [Sanghuangporus baumii]|uniref:Uncharacterized protein n=1 Tax=Sanghuangporus baumii TaxID=108892 RepID=A0A9Q5HSW4_SANBA|nr:hypothetical protein A7U60_g7702 [Sanghuangporus baumii]
MVDDEVLVEDLRESDRVCRRKSDVQGKLYNFLNRSAQSLTRSNSQSGRSRRAKERDKDKIESDDRDSPRASHATSSRLPVLSSGNAPETSPQSRLPSSARTSRSAANTGNGAATSGGELPSRKSSSPPLTPLGQHKHTLSIPPQSKTPTIAYTYNTPPQTPARSRKYSNPSSPNSITGGRDLLLNRPLARPITPSNSSSGKKLFGISLPSPTHRKASLLEAEEGTPKRQSGHKLRSGSGSSNEPLLHDRSPSNSSGRTGSIPRPSTITPRPNNNNNRTSEDRTTTTPLPTPSSSLPRSTRSAVSREDQPPASPTTTSSRRGTPRLDFWRSLTPRAPSPQGDREKEREKEKGKQRAATPDASTQKVIEKQQELVSPQPRAAPAAFLPRFQRTPATPRRGEEADAPNTVRLDSFMSDSLPIPQDTVKTPLAQADNGRLGLTRQHAFTTQTASTDLPRSPRTPAPERQKTSAAPALGIQRSNSAPGSRGRLSPCLRIPSPKFLSRERSRSKDKDWEKEKEKEKEREKGMISSEKRKVTPESVGAPILREPRTYVHAHGHSHAHAHGVAGGAVNEKGGIGGSKAPKASLVQLRRAAHGTFDFERPGSRTSSKSGQSESRGTRSDDEREKENEKETEANDSDVRRTFGGLGRSVSARPPDFSARAKLKASSPVPPLPTTPSRVKAKPHSPPPPTFPRTRSPLAAVHHAAPGSAAHSHSHSHATHIDDSALPRLSSSSARRNSSSNQHFRTPGYSTGGVYRPPTSLPHFSFEPAASRVPSPPSVPPKPVRDAGGQYVDTRTGLIMYAHAPASPESRSPKSPKSPTGKMVTVVDDKTRSAAAGRRMPATGTSAANANGHANPNATSMSNGIPQRELEEATAVITQFKSALDEAGFATLQKYVRRYDAKIIPLDGAAGLLARVQRLLDTSAPRVDERRKRQLYENFVRVVRVSQVS